MREYSIYYAPKTVTPIDESTDPVTPVRGTIFFGIRERDLLLRNGDFYKGCGFYVLSEVTTLLPPDPSIVSSLIMSNTTDAQRIAVVEELSFSIVPVDPAKTLNPYNKLYNTGIPFATSVSRSIIVERLQAARFNFVSNGETFSYRVESNTIKEKRQKKSAPIYN